MGEDKSIGKGQLLISYFSFDASQYRLSGDPKLDINIKELDGKFKEENINLPQ